jgi:hypothetical protein
MAAMGVCECVCSSFATRATMRCEFDDHMICLLEGVRVSALEAGAPHSSVFWSRASARGVVGAFFFKA